MNKPNMSQGNPPSKKDVQKKFFDFMYMVLSDFKPFSKDDNGKIVVSEDLITQDLEKELNLKARETNAFFAFQNQHKVGQYTTDISAYRVTSYEEFCWIEAKRLPTPNAGKTRDKREYVFVDKTNDKFKGNGGIQRFKEGKHASTLTFSVMIGYIQFNDAPYWLKQINRWITNLANEYPMNWNTNDCLQELTSEMYNTFISLHDREKDLGQIVLQHFWINV